MTKSEYLATPAPDDLIRLKYFSQHQAQFICILILTQADHQAG